MPFELPVLPFKPASLEPFMDEATVNFHHDRHHKGYTNNLNVAVAANKLEGMSIEEILNNVSKYPAAVRNNAGGFYNHNLFWENLSPKGGGEPKGALKTAINETFGSFKQFKELFYAAALTRFGSGWAWLIVNKEGKLEVCSTPNQDNTLMDVSEVKGFPILAIDVWEHAYYLQYHNHRDDYILGCFNIINWNVVEARYNALVKK